MVVDRLRSHLVHQPVKALRGKALEEGIRLTAAPDAVYHVEPLVVFCDHLVDRVDIVLQVRVHGDHHVRIASNRHKAGQKRVLVPAVSGQVDAGKQRILFVELFDDAPGSVRGAVIDKDHPAGTADPAAAHQRVHLFLKAARRLRKNRLFVVAWKNNIEYV